MKRKELVKRYSLFIISLWFSALGVAVTKCGSLGVSCISSVPNVLSLRFTHPRDTSRSRTKTGFL